ncbi:unnamed protein product [Gadus morhua 'NCC']
MQLISHNALQPLGTHSARSQLINIHGAFRWIRQHRQQHPGDGRLRRLSTGSCEDRPGLPGSVAVEASRSLMRGLSQRANYHGG